MFWFQTGLMSMPMITMSFPWMPPTQYYRTILLRPIQNPKPHNSTHAFSSDGMPALGMVHRDSFERGASMSSSSHLSLYFPCWINPLSTTQTNWSITSLQPDILGWKTLSNSNRKRLVVTTFSFPLFFLSTQCLTN